MSDYSPSNCDVCIGCPAQVTTGLDQSRTLDQDAASPGVSVRVRRGAISAAGRATCIELSAASDGREVDGSDLANSRVSGHNPKIQCQCSGSLIRIHTGSERPHNSRLADRNARRRVQRETQAERPKCVPKFGFTCIKQRSN